MLMWMMCSKKFLISPEVQITYSRYHNSMILESKQ